MTWLTGALLREARLYGNTSLRDASSLTGRSCVELGEIERGRLTLSTEEMADILESLPCKREVGCPTCPATWTSTWIPGPKSTQPPTLNCLNCLRKEGPSGASCEVGT